MDLQSFYSRSQRDFKKRRKYNGKKLVVCQNCNLGQATKSCTHDYVVFHGIPETKQNLFYLLLAHSLLKAWKFHEKNVLYAFTEHIDY